MTTNILFISEVLLSIFVFNDFNFNLILITSLLIGPVIGYVNYKVLNSLPPKNTIK